MLTELIFIVIYIIVYIVFLLWYGGEGKPLTHDETEELLSRISDKAGDDKDSSMLLDNLRTLTAEDDGKNYYMVNLMKFNKPTEDNPDPMGAHKRYSKAIVPALLKFGGHPVFVSDVQSRFLHPDSADDWDQVAMIRYRSRRDMLMMVLSMADKDEGQDKWLALENTHVFPVKPTINLIFIRLAFGVLLSIIMLLVYLFAFIV